jgi:hypothetical protein
MYFLNGDRIYIKPGHACGTLQDQIEDCLLKTQQMNSGKRIFKLNYFVDTASEEAYSALQLQVKNRVSELFAQPVIQTFIAQPPLTCKIIVEAFFYDPMVWQMQPVAGYEHCAVVFRKEEEQILVGNIQANEAGSCKINSEKAFISMNLILAGSGFSMNNVVRQWNYIENILGFDDREQRYQEFNDVRSHHYGNAFEITGYPAATGIGMNRGGVIIEFVAARGNKIITKPVDNPAQISAHAYSNKVLVGEECVLKTTPKFERARYFEFEEKKQVFISGTASITGEHTVGVGDPALQTEVTIQNIQRLYSKEVLQKISEAAPEPKYGHARVYVKRRKDFAVIRQTFKQHFGNLPVVYIIADICRNDLLVEIEGKVILE